MNLLHVGDLHLGRSIDRWSLIEDQRYILDQIIELAKEHRVSGILLAGDVYDSAQPSERARALYNHFVSRCLTEGIALYVIAGNHDSRQTIEFAREPLHDVGMYSAGVLRDIWSPIVHRVDERTGDVADTSEVHIWLLPYVTRRQLQDYYRRHQESVGDTERAGTCNHGVSAFGVTAEVSSAATTRDQDYLLFAAQADADHQNERDGIQHVSIESLQKQSAGSVDEAVCAEVRSNESSAADSKAEINLSFTQLMTYMMNQSMQGYCEDACNILLAHQYVVAGHNHHPETCESEQQIHPSHIFDALDIQAFQGMDYVALGHLHKPQCIGAAHLRYAGTPLVYARGEVNQEKSVTLLSIVDGTVNITALPLRPRHPMRILVDTYHNLRSRYKDGCEDYVYITLTDTEESPFHYAELSALFPRLLSMTYEGRTADRLLDNEGGDAQVHESIADQFSQYFREILGRDMNDEQHAYIGQLLERIADDGEEERCNLLP